MLNFGNKDIFNLAISIIRRCNLSCSYCYADLKPQDTMGIEMFERAIDLFLSSQGKHKNIIFTGGEPTLNPAALRGMLFLVRAKKRKFRAKKIVTVINTNGTLLNQKILDLFKETDYVSISIDGLANTHNLHRNFPDRRGSFLAVFKNLEQIRKRFPGKIAINKVTTSQTAQNFLSDVLFLANLAPRYISLSIAYGDTGWNKKNTGEFLDSSRRLNQIINKNKTYQKMFLDIYDPITQECVLSSLSIGPKGGIFPCEIALNRMPSSSFGNIESGYLESGLSKCEFSLKRKECQNEACMHCEKICISGFRWLGEPSNGQDKYFKKALSFRSVFQPKRKTRAYLLL